jgi:RHS repeat-associated protein
MGPIVKDGEVCLLRCNGGYSFSFGYDDAFNPTTWKGAGQTFNSNNQRTGTGFGYDGNGNPTTYKGATCVFDPENRMTAYGTALTAGYRGDGLRGWKQTAGGRTYFLYDGITPVVELSSAGAVTAVNVFGHDGLVARTGVENMFYMFDQQGNASQRLNSSQTITSSSTYDSYGSESNVGTPTDPFAYNGRWGYYADRGCGLTLCTNRYYDASSGRWLTRDPISYNGGINLYGYVTANPQIGIDATGMGLLRLFGGIVGGLVGGAAGFFVAGPAGVLPGAAIGAGVGSTLGSLGEGKSLGQAAFGGLVDGAVTYAGGLIVGKCVSLIRAGRAAGEAVPIAGEPAAIGPGENFPHYSPNPNGAPYTKLRPNVQGGYDSGVTYDGEGYALRRTDLASRSGRSDHGFPHFHDMTWVPSARNPLGAPEIGPAMPPDW